MPLLLLALGVSDRFYRQVVLDELWLRHFRSASRVVALSTINLCLSWLCKKEAVILRRGRLLFRLDEELLSRAQRLLLSLLKVSVASSGRLHASRRLYRSVTLILSLAVVREIVHVLA